MKKVLQVVYGLHHNGTETAVMNIYKSLDRNRVQFDFLIFDGKGQDYAEEIRGLGGNIYVLPPKKLFSSEYSNAIKAFFREHASEYDAVHFNFNYLSRTLPFELAEKYGIPVRLLHSHNSGYLRGKFNYYLHLHLRKKIARLTTHHIGCSPEAAEWMFGDTVAEKDSRVIINGIPTENFLYDPQVREEYRKNLGIENDRLVIGQVGFFQPVKNHEFTIEIAKELVKRIPDVKFLLIGAGGTCEATVREKVKEYGLEDNIVLTGRRNDVNRLLQAMDIMVMPSVHEGLPLALVEAQTAGLKAICSTNVSQLSKCTDNLDFLPIDQGPGVWVDRILEIRGYKRENLRQHFADSPYNVKVMAQEFAKIY